ncbi:MAG: hypothetical protein HFI48_14370 [Lachnospiraceae bacterium]|nr:hypothetical protein [Lachnospiraceae bacterium]
MKYLKFFGVIFLICLLFGCGTKDNISENAKEEIKNDVVQMKGNEVIKESGVKISLEPITCDIKQVKNENNFSVSIDSKEGQILLFDTVSKKELASFEESYGSGNLFLSMIDENNGVFLYCSSPAGGQMMKQMYITKDRWRTWSQMDISSQIDGYPTSLSAQSDKHLYIGVQMRSDGYLFETIDGGKNWNPVIIDEAIEKCRYGYAPILNNEEGNFYILLECDGFYSLYQSDVDLSAWIHLGTFSTEMEIESYFIWNSKVIIADIQGQQYQLSFNQI